jgi:hypothetical protein
VSTDGLTYDTGALVAAERDDRIMWSLHRAALRRGLPPVVPAGVLAEGCQGGVRGPQANLSRLLKGCEFEDLTKARAGAVGTLAARANHDDIVDVSVAEGAVRRNHAVVTSNLGHIRTVATAAGANITIHSV